MDFPKHIESAAGLAINDKKDVPPLPRALAFD